MKVRSHFNTELNLWKKLQVLETQLDCVIEPDLNKFLLKAPETFLKYVICLPEFTFSDNHVALRVLNELYKLYEVKSICQVVGLLWEFEAFFKDMADIWSYIPLPQHKIIRAFNL